MRAPKAMPTIDGVVISSDDDDDDCATLGELLVVVVVVVVVVLSCAGDGVGTEQSWNSHVTSSFRVAKQSKYATAWLEHGVS